MSEKAYNFIFFSIKISNKSFLNFSSTSNLLFCKIHPPSPIWSINKDKGQERQMRCWSVCEFVIGLWHHGRKSDWSITAVRRTEAKDCHCTSTGEKSLHPAARRGHICSGCNLWEGLCPFCYSVKDYNIHIYKFNSWLYCLRIVTRSLWALHKTPEARCWRIWLHEYDSCLMAVVRKI